MNLELTFTAQVPAEQACLSIGDDDLVRGLAVPFGVPSAPSSSDGKRYQFDGPPDNADELVDVVREHNDDALVGALAEPWETTKAGLNAVAELFDTALGRDTRTEAQKGRRKGFSVSAVIKRFTTTPDGVRKVTSWDARHLGVVRRPAFSTAGIQFSTTATKETTVDPDTKPDIDLSKLAVELLDLPQVKELSEKLANLPTVAELAEQVGEIVGKKQDGHPLAAFSNAAEFYAEFQKVANTDPDAADALQAAFAVPDQITGDNPGVMAPGWRKDIKSRIDRRQPAIRAFGTIGLPDSGMTASWPFLDPALDIDDIVKQQLAEKNELQGVKIKILKGDEPILTAGAVSDISYQLLLRSSPSYLAAHNDILFAAFARYLEAKFENRIFEDGHYVGVAPATAAALKTMLFTASSAVQNATGSPADIALVSTDKWIQYGGFDLPNPKYGTQNVAGTSDARRLQVDVNGFVMEEAPFLPNGTVIVASSDAAKAPTSGARIATGEDVRRLGRDVAVWGMYEEAEVYFPNGIQVYAPADPDA